MRLFALFTILALSACAQTPRYVRPAAPVPLSWPIGDAYLAHSEAQLASFTFKDIFRDPRLQKIIEQALTNNRDLRIAAANIRAARAQYRIQRAERLPLVEANGSVSAARSGSGSTIGTNTQFESNLGITAFELDLFGRIAALTQAEQERYFATEATARATRLALIGDIANAWTAYAADASLLKIAQDTARSAALSVVLTQARLRGGIASRVDVRQAEQVLATAEADVAEQRMALAQDANALQLLVGSPVDPALYSANIAEMNLAIASLPAGLNSEILLRRPDVMQAEFELRAANASIGAARAARFPTLSLTGLLGLASGSLNALFNGRSFAFTTAASGSIPIFDGGAARAGVAQSEAQRDAALANYERAIQTAFREVSDALARQGTIADQIAANRKLVAAAADTAKLTDARYRGGVDSFLASLDAQRAQYTAQRGHILTQQIRADNLVALYRALGGEEANIGIASADPVRR